MSDMNWPALYARRAERMKASEIRELLKVLDQPDIISFAGGIPDPALFPAEAVRAAFAEALRDGAGSHALQYSLSEGYGPLREWIVGHMARLGVACDAANILITSGSQQGLEFVGKLLLSPGDTALVTAPTYLGALQAFGAYEPRYDRLRLEGRSTPAAFRQTAEAGGSRIKFAYLVPDFQNPTGETVGRQARERLLDLAAELGIAVIEDAAYQALRFEGDEIPPVLALDISRAGSIEAARTIYCGTFSKTVAPALRIGWICAAKALIEKLVLVKQASDLHSATVNQIVMHRVAEAVHADQVSRARAAYRARRDAMLDALGRFMPPGVTWTRPEGGMFVWLTLPEGIDTEELLRRALREARIAYVPGRAFFADASVTNTLRLSYSLATPEQIETGLSRLGRLIADAGRGAMPSRAFATG